MNFNPELMALAQWRLDQLEKSSFVPPGDPSGGGAPPPGMDPAMMGGGGGAPPMDPSMMGGAPPMDPAMMGAAPPMPGGGGMTADTVQQIVTQTMQQMGGGGGPTAGGAGKQMKADINTVAMDIFQVKKMLQYLFQVMNIPLPPDILDGPNRDPRTGAMMPPGAPGSTSDPSMAAPPMPAGGGAPALPSAGAGLPPAGPMPGADPSGGMPPKQSQDLGSAQSFDSKTLNKAAALLMLMGRLKSE